MSKVYIVYFEDLRWYAFAAKVIQYFGFKENNNKINHVGLLIDQNLYDITLSSLRWHKREWSAVLEAYKGHVYLLEIGEGLPFTKQQMKTLKKKFFYGLFSAIASQELASSITDNIFTRFIDSFIDFLSNVYNILVIWRGHNGKCSQVTLYAGWLLKLSNRVKLKKEIEEYMIRVKKNPGFDEVTPANMFAELGFDIQVK